MKKKNIKFAPVFRPLNISVIGIDKHRNYWTMQIMEPYIQYDSNGNCKVFVYLPIENNK